MSAPHPPHLILGGIRLPLRLELLQQQGEQLLQLGGHLLGEELGDVVLGEVLVDAPSDQYPQAHQQLQQQLGTERSGPATPARPRRERRRRKEGSNEEKLEIGVLTGSSSASEESWRASRATVRSAASRPVRRVRQSACRMYSTDSLDPARASSGRCACPHSAADAPRSRSISGVLFCPTAADGDARWTGGGLLEGGGGEVRCRFGYGGQEGTSQKMTRSAQLHYRTRWLLTC